jgi:hypothetical protein
MHAKFRDVILPNGIATVDEQEIEVACAINWEKKPVGGGAEKLVALYFLSNT